MGDTHHEVFDLTKVESAAQGFSVAAHGFRLAAEKFRSATEGYGRAVEESATASDEFEVATAELRDVSNWLEHFRSAVRDAESEFQVATDTAPVATGTPVHALVGDAIARLKRALVDAGPAKLGVQAAEGRLAAAQVQRLATDALLGPAKAALAAAEAELRVAGDKVRVAAHADFPVTVDEGVFAYREIANLKEIYNPADSLLKFALEDWQQKQQDLATKVLRRENKCADLTNQIFGIIGWYAVFQGVVLTAVAQLAQANWKEPGATPMCKKIWFPIILTVFSTAVIVGGSLYKFRALEEMEVTINTERAARSELERRVRTLRNKGPVKFRFSKDSDNGSKQKDTAPSSYWKNSIPVIVSLLLFTGLFILSYLAILCDTWAK